ncbi:MAG TPA: class I SAM-dependent methyltransferase [Anaeromyxobacteraceae bacterium]|nr:class I SAM-dependent methyltransferase [Anaeromyxobacteraceae bacterium]
MTGSYRDLFTAEGAATAYEEGQYEAGSYWEILWELEKPILDDILEELRRHRQSVCYLDFACGSGRILSYVEERCDKATGVDVSSEMLKRASTRVRKATLVQRDITVDGASVEGRYDLITAFRFLLNAEPELRVAGLCALAARLRDGDSRLVVSVHGNPLSYKALVGPYRRVRALIKGYPAESLLSVAQTRHLLAGAGLEVVSVHGMGLFPARMWSALPRRIALAVEGSLMHVPLIPRFGVNQVLVCRRSGEG